MCETSIEEPGRFAHGLVLLGHALVLHRHLPPREGDHATAEGAMFVEEGRAEEGRGSVGRHGRDLP